MLNAENIHFDLSLIRPKETTVPVEAMRLAEKMNRAMEDVTVDYKNIGRMKLTMDWEWKHIGYRDTYQETDYFTFLDLDVVVQSLHPGR